MKKLVKYFNNLIEKTIFKVKNKTNIKFQTSNFNMKKLVKNFNNLIEKTIFKVQNKTNTKFQISNFNKYVITFISLLFFYLFYLSVPVLYDKAWVQSNIENQLFKEYKINFSISSEVSYRILPKPHFLIKDSKIFKEEGDKKVSLVDIKNLKVFISQKSFFGKRKINIKNIKIDKANFLLLRGDFKLLKNSSKKKFSKKRIDISNSNIFFKDNSDETLTIIKLSKAFLFQDDENLLNLFNLKGKVFNIPFNFDYKKKFNYPLTEEINIIAKTLKLNIFDIFNNDEDNLNNGSNIISFLNSKIKTDYKIEDDILIFNSSNSKIKNSEIDYKGELSIDPFDLKLDINIIDNQELFRILNINLILNELVKTKLFFNENISLNTSITRISNSNRQIFQNVKINFNITNGKINFDKTRLINKKIGLLELENSNLLFQNDRLILTTDIVIKIENSKELFSLLQTNKKSRKLIKDILVNVDYDFLANQIRFNNIKIDNKKVSDEMLRIMEDFSDNKFNNLNKSKRILNSILSIYEG